VCACVCVCVHSIIPTHFYDKLYTPTQYNTIHIYYTIYTFYTLYTLHTSIHSTHLYTYIYTLYTLYTLYSRAGLPRGRVLPRPYGAHCRYISIKPTHLCYKYVLNPHIYSITHALMVRTAGMYVLYLLYVLNPPVYATDMY
jgi:hypothetical protein